MNVTYLDNAATSFPKPPEVHQAMVDFLRNVGGSPGRSGHRMAHAAEEVVWSTRESLAKLIGLRQAYRLVFTPNATIALNIVLKGYLQPGDYVVVTGFEHNSVMRPLVALAQKDIQYDILKCTPEGTVDLDDLTRIVSQRPPQLLVVTQASNVTGTLLPIAQISEIAAQVDAAILVDAAQSIGAYPLQITDWARLDFLAFSGHKSLLGPQGTGALYVAEGVELRPLYEGGTGSQSESMVQPEWLPDHLESGTLNAVGIAGLGAGVQFILSRGVETIFKHEKHLTACLLDGLARIPGVIVYGRLDTNSRLGVVSFNVEGQDSGEVSHVLDQEFAIMSRPGLHCAPLAHRTIGTFPSGAIRLSLGYANTLQDVELALQAIAQIACRFH